jgi:hypothetical protein
LDALVAEKVMGCTVYWEPWAVGGDKPRCDCPGANSPLPRPHGEPVTGYVKHFSTDIAAAWEVFEKITSELPTVERPNPFNDVFIERSTDWGADKMDVLGWRVGRQVWFGRQVWSSVETIAWAPTAPHAICLAALKSVGVGL